MNPFSSASSRKFVTVLMVGLGTLTACQSNSPRQQSQGNSEFSCIAGTIGGAVIGGLLGSTIGQGRGRTAATAIGAGVGGVIGNRAGCN